MTTTTEVITVHLQGTYMPIDVKEAVDAGWITHNENDGTVSELLAAAREAINLGQPLPTIGGGLAVIDPDDVTCLAYGQN